jgi:hypothetical protein
MIPSFISDFFGITIKLIMIAEIQLDFIGVLSAKHFIKDVCIGFEMNGMPVHCIPEFTITFFQDVR